MNNSMPAYVARLVDEMAETYGVSRIAILGAAYKPNVGDFRKSPSFEIMHELQRRGYAVEIHDPHRDDLNRPLEVVCARADLLLIATDHKVYREECASS